MAVDMDGLAWPVERLGDAFRELLTRGRLADGTGEFVREPRDSAEVADWIENAAKGAGCDAEPLATTLQELPNELAKAYPAILEAGESRYLAILRVKPAKVMVLTPDLKKKAVSLAELCRLLRAQAAGTDCAGLQSLLGGLAISERRSRRAAEVLLNEQFANVRFSRCWVLSAGPGAKMSRLLREAAIPRTAVAIAVLHAVQSLLWLASWAMLGNLSFEGRIERGWITGWALLLLSMVPCQVLTTRLQGFLTIGAGWIIKRRLLSGALKLRTEEIRQGGIGSFLGQALEAEAFETLSSNGAIAGLLAVMEILLAMCVLGPVAALLAVWLLLTAWAGWRFLRGFEGWTESRLEITNHVIEAMVGHRTRLAQLPREQWHDTEDHELNEYVGVSKALDKAGVFLMAAIPRTWLLAGLACLAPAVVVQQGNQTSISVALGGVLLAYTALRKLTGSSTEIAAAWVAFLRISPLVHAAARPEKAAKLLCAAGRRSRTVLEAERLNYRYRATGKPALQNGSLTIREGDRILLEGPSGGGKSTFAALLAGTRMPESGLLLASGLDRDTLGDRGWCRMVAAAPQFHENHILTETLAFNLLLGRRWPPLRSDMEEAEEMCRELGLGDLLDRMPGGLLQMVGEGGWQLSHGEKSRVFIARALLQSPELVILDESFAALDPENARAALETAMARAKTLMVIAHP